MSNWNGDRWKRRKRQPETATTPGPKPGDFSLGSLESRAAARAVIQGKGKRKKIIHIVSVAPGPEPGTIRVVSTKDIEIEDPGQ